MNRGKQRYTSVLVARSAGQKAFIIGVDPSNNPYSGDARKAWEKGFYDEMNTREVHRPAHGARPTLRVKYPAHARLPYGDKLPERPFKYRGRFREEAINYVALSFAS